MRGKKILFGVLAIMASVMLSISIAACDMSGASIPVASSIVPNSSNTQNDGSSSATNMGSENGDTTSGSSVNGSGTSSSSESSSESSSDGEKDDSTFDYLKDCVKYTFFYDGDERRSAACVSGYTGSPTKVKILSTCQGVPVSHIRNEAFENCSSLTSVEIPDSVTYIGYGAFSGCSSLTSVEIPDSVTFIGGGAFSGCSSLEEITLPFVGEAKDGRWNKYFGCIFGESSSSDNASSLKKVKITSATSIWDYAFKNCSSLTSIEIPDSVTSIGESAFEGCSSLTSIEIPDSVTSIGGSAFYDCSSLTSIEIPDSVTSIGDWAFVGCSGLTSVEIGDSVTSIGYEAFACCSSLTSIEIPNSVTSIGDGAFYNCSGLTSVVIGDGVTSIGDKAFYGCSSLEEIMLPFVGASKTAYNNGYEKVFGYIFGYTTNTSREVDGLTRQYETWSGTTHEYYHYYIPTSLKTVTIRGESIPARVFLNCSNLTSLVIGDGVTSIGESAFEGCSSLTSIEIPNSVTSIGGYAFENCSSLTSVVIGDSVTSISRYAFAGCSSLTSVEIPNSVTSIEKAAFRNCSSLTSVVIGDGVTSIGERAFEGCSSLTGVYYNGTIDEWAQIEFGPNPLSYAQNLYIDNELVTEAKITTATEISAYAFYNCSSLTSVVMPDSVTSIGSSAFSGCSSLTSVVIPDSVTSIGWGTFSKCSSLTSVVIPDSVTSIGSSAFEDCSNLEEITLPFVGATKNGTKNTHLGYIFGASRASYNELHIPSSLKKVTVTSAVAIDKNAFRNCNNLEEISLPFVGESKTASNGYNQVFGYIFGYTTETSSDSVEGLTYQYRDSSSRYYHYYIPESLKTVTITGGSIPVDAFYNCSNLTSVEIPDGVTYIGGSAFENCRSLTIYCEVVSQPSGWGSKWNSSRPVVWDCKNNDVTDDGYIYTMIDGVRYAIKDGEGTVARQPSNIQTANIPASITYKNTAYSVTSIDSSAFAYCSSLTSVVIPNSVTSIGEYAFSGCRSLTSVVIGDSVTSISRYAFAGCSSLTSVEIPNSVTSIGGYAFYNCSSLTSIDIPNSVTSIGDYAFYNCSSLTSVVIPESVTSIGDYAFKDCSNLTDISVSENNANYKSIDGNLYSKDGTMLIQYAIGKKETKITIPDGVTSIGNYAFYNCSSLTSVVIGDSVTSIGEGAFYECSSLTSVVIPNSVTSIGKYAFSCCSGLTDISVSENNANYKSIDGNLYSKDGTMLIQYAIGKKETKITIPDGVTSIGDRAFLECNSLTSVEIGDGVTSIGSSVFYNCSSLASVVISDSVTSIDQSAFGNCSNLTSVYYNGTASDWNAIDIVLSWTNYELTSAMRYYYSEEVPTEEGNYWHYVNGVITKW